jgi:predicted DNA-binding protein
MDLNKQVRVSEDLHQRLKVLAAERKCSMATIVKKLIDHGLKEEVE